MFKIVVYYIRGDCMKETMKTYSVRLDSKQRKELENLAKKEQRTVSNLLRVIINEYLEQKK